MKMEKGRRDRARERVGTKKKKKEAMVQRKKLKKKEKESRARMTSGRETPRCDAFIRLETNQKVNQR